MTRYGRSDAILISGIFGVGLLLATIGLLYSEAHAQSADLVLCDRLAADPADPEKPADVKGTRDVERSDIATAIKFCKVASATSRRALYELGRAYAANQQLLEAVAAYRKAAEKGSTSAMVELGLMLANGSGVPKDEAQARKLFERAAQAGNPRAIATLAALPDRVGMVSDPVKNRALLSKAAEANSADAQYQLGLMMAEGVGGPRTTLPPARCLKGQRNKIILARWSAWVHLPRVDGAVRRTRLPRRTITAGLSQQGTKTPRLN
jgi:uncharacterized protein